MYIILNITIFLIMQTPQTERSHICIVVPFKIVDSIVISSVINVYFFKKINVLYLNIF